MLTFSLNSGSNGNSIYVEAGGVRLLFDAGLSGRRSAERMREHGRDIRKVDALIISHDHADHVGCAGVLQRLFHFPMYITEPTYRAARNAIGKVSDVRHFAAGETLHFKDVAVHTIRTPHDAVDGVVFVVEHAGKRLGIFTDLGHGFLELRAALETVDAVYLESNYDPHMLETGPYHRDLKQRIRGGSGHISNEEAGGLAAGHGGRLQWMALAHLSAENNHPDIAMQTARRLVRETLPLHLASRERSSGQMVIS